MTTALVALACLPLLMIAGVAGPVLRRELALRRWRQGHPALVPLRLAASLKK